MRAVSFKAPPILDSQGLATQLAIEPPAGKNGQLTTVCQTDEFACNEQVFGVGISVEATFLPNGYGLGDVEVSVDKTVDVDVSEASELATDFTTDRNNCFRAMSVLRRNISAKDPHGTCFSLLIT